jgi:hypothetical protein
MSHAMSVKVFSPLLLAAATMVGGGLATPAAAQRVEVFVNGQRVTDIVVNGRVRNGANGHVNGANGYADGADYADEANGYIDGADGYGDDGSGYINGANNPRPTNGNGAQYRFLDGGNGGSDLRRGFHSDSHVGPYDECFRDRRTGVGHCTGRHWGRHSGPHRGLYRRNGSPPVY